MEGAGKCTWTKVSHTKDCCNDVSKPSVRKKFGVTMIFDGDSLFPQPDLLQLIEKIHGH